MKASSKGFVVRKDKAVITVRRKSSRRCEKETERERLEGWKEKVRRKQTVAGLKVVELRDKGRGVVSTHYIPIGTFICEYSGMLISKKEAVAVEKEYEMDETIGCYMYYLRFKGKKYCVDQWMLPKRMAVWED